MSPNLRKEPEVGSLAWQREQIQKRSMAASQPGGFAATPPSDLKASTSSVKALTPPPVENGGLQGIDLQGVFNRLGATSWKTMEGKLTWLVTVAGLALLAGGYVLVYKERSLELANEIMVYGTILVSGGQVVGVGGRTIVKTILGLVARAAFSPPSQNKDMK